MRVLSAMRLCDEVGEEEYKANPVTEALASPGGDGGTKYMSVHLLCIPQSLDYFCLI
jgi:hypothetical protein